MKFSHITLPFLILLLPISTLALPLSSSSPSTPTSGTSGITAIPNWKSKMLPSETLHLSTLATSFGDFEAQMFNKYKPHYCSGDDIINKKCVEKCSYRYDMDDTEGLLVGKCMSIYDENAYLEKKKKVADFETEMAGKYAA